MDSITLRRGTTALCSAVSSASHGEAAMHYVLVIFDENFRSLSAAARQRFVK